MRTYYICHLKRFNNFKTIILGFITEDNPSLSVYYEFGEKLPIDHVEFLEKYVIIVEIKI